MRNTKKLTFAALGTALTIALLFVASLVQTGTLAFQFAGGIFIMLIMSKCGAFYGAASFSATSLLCFILLPDKSHAISYILFFGSIPIVKFFAEKGSRILEWIIKLIFMNLCVLGLFLVFRTAVAVSIPIAIIWLAALFVAIGYDILLSFAFPYALRYFNKKT